MKKVLVSIAHPDDETLGMEALSPSMLQEVIKYFVFQ